MHISGDVRLVVMERKFQVILAGLREGDILIVWGLAGSVLCPLVFCSRFLFTCFSLSYDPLRIMAAADSTSYVAGAILEPALRQVFHVTGMPETFRLKLANQGVSELLLFANIADNMNTYKDLISSFLTEEELGLGPRRVLSLTRMANSWEKARIIITPQNSARTCVIEDPTRIPEMPVLEHS